MKNFAICSAVISTLTATPAPAAVRYVFEELTPSFEVSGSFAFTSSEFISGSPIFGIGDMEYCTGRGICTFSQMFSSGPMSDFPNYDVVAFGVSPTISYYYFSPLDFQTYGRHDTVLGGVTQAARLTVTQLGSAVPEPATWLTMIFGFGFAAFSLRSNAGTKSHLTLKFKI